MAEISERSTAALELTFKDEDGSLVSVGTMTAFLFELWSEKPGASNPVLTSAVVPTANPYLLVLDLTGTDIDAVGTKLSAYFKLTYNSATLGTGAILRDGPFEIHLKNNKIPT
jgi:hypothetical protein